MLPFERQLTLRVHRTPLYMARYIVYSNSQLIEYSMSLTSIFCVVHMNIMRCHITMFIAITLLS